MAEGIADIPAGHIAVSVPAQTKLKNHLTSASNVNMKFFLAGHNNFGNRGCEALVRSTTGMIHSRLNESSFYCPSRLAELDKRQWTDSDSVGIKFVEASPFSNKLRWWSRACKIISPIEALYRPRCPLDSQSYELVKKSDALIMTGGDVISLDYGVASVYFWANFVEHAVNLGKPAILWAASVGPFTAKPAVEREMVKHLKRYAAITVRESATYEYLQGLGLNHVQQVADPAFTMTPEAFDVTELTFGNNQNVLGLNVSPLVRGYRKDKDSRELFDRDVVNFIKDVVGKTDMSVLLVPHVDPLDGSSVNSDSAYMQGLLAQLGLHHDRVRLAPRNLNAAQLKYLISNCRFFIGARTHATIGAFSTGVPTISIAYSAKAKGINKDLFGDTRFVLDTNLVSRATLHDSLDLLIHEEDATRSLLHDRIPEFRENAHKSVDALIATLGVSR